MPNWEDLSGDPPSATTSAQAVDAGRVQQLAVSYGFEIAKVAKFTKSLAHDQAQVEKVAWALERAKERNTATVKALAIQNQSGRPATPEQYAELGRELGLEDDLRLERERLQGRIQATQRAIRRAERNAQELQRVINLAIAQAEALERARSPRLRAAAVARFIWQLLQGRSGLWSGIVRNLYLGMRVVGVLLWMLPKTDRTRWKDESYNQLEELKQEDAPLLGDALRIALRIPWLALVLWTGAWRRSPAARWLPRLKPVWIGVGTATATFWTGLAGIGQHPTEWQMRKLVAASLLTGVVALTGSLKGRRPRRRSRRRKR